MLRSHQVRSVAVVSAALLGTSLLATATPASAYFGPESTARGQLLTAAELFKAGGWNTTTRPLTAKIERGSPYEWVMAVPPTPAMTTTDVVPEFSQLIVLSDKAERTLAWNEFSGILAGQATSSVTANGVTTYRLTVPDNGGGTPVVQSYSMLRAGNDSIAAAGCISSSTTTATAAQRDACATAVARAQAAKWERFSPPFTLESAGKVNKALLTAKQARRAVELPRGFKTFGYYPDRQRLDLGGYSSTRRFGNPGSKAVKAKKVSLPISASISEYGNRTNAKAAFRIWKSTDGRTSKLYGATANRYTISFKQKVGNKTVRVALTARRYADVIVIGVCSANPKNQPKASKVRTCSKRLALAQEEKARPLFRNAR